MEEWKPVVGFEGLYEVSSLGRVKSVMRRQGAKTGIMKLIRGSNGYLHLRLYKNKEWSQHRVAPLVAAAFIGPRRVGHDVCHNNGNRTDNRVSNLRYDTRSNNLADRVAHGTANRGERQGRSKLTTEKVLAIKALLADGVTQAVIAQQFGVSRSAILCINIGRTWGWLKCSN